MDEATRKALDRAIEETAEEMGRRLTLIQVWTDEQFTPAMDAELVRGNTYTVEVLARLREGLLPILHGVKEG